MKKYMLAIAVVAVLYVGWGQVDGTHARRASTSGDEAVASAFREQRSGVKVTGAGVVTAVLPDDKEGDRHQRFIVRLLSGRSLLVVHNVDLAPRLTSLESGDSVAFSGVYEWNAKGGLVHWTHHDPGGRHPGGWLRHRGETIQ